MSIWKYSDRWDAPPLAEAVTLGEGGTPLIRSQQIGASLGLKNLWFKYEGANPTGSYKDRFAASAISHLKRAGRRACLGTSSGNTGAALAAYCARAGMQCYLAIVEGAPEGKLRQMLAYGAKLYRLKDFGSSPAVNGEVMGGLPALADQMGVGYEISAFAYSPRGMSGVKTISYEIVEALPKGPLSIFSPAGAGGLTLAVARGVVDTGAKGRVHCVQPVGNDTIATPLRLGRERATAVKSSTAISGLQVGSIIDGDATIEACRKSGGQGYAVEDDIVFAWQGRMAREEGIFSEPAGAVALAGVEQALARGELATDEPVVCLVTGSGFKDERSLIRMVGSEPTVLLNGFGEFVAAVRSDFGGAGV